jgi:hypothetical protein
MTAGVHLENNFMPYDTSLKSNVQYSIPTVYVENTAKIPINYSHVHQTDLYILFKI